MTDESSPLPTPGSFGRWNELARRILEGHAITDEEGMAILRSDDVELLDLLAAAYRVRYRWCGNRVSLNFLINAKSGQCGEDCGYCSQSRVSQADIPRYSLLEAEKLLHGARLAAEHRARTYCIATSGRSPGPGEFEVITRAAARIKKDYDLKICVSPGLLDDRQARALKASGVDRVNHNLNTSERYYPRICSTHSYQERLATLRAIREAGMEICCGGIIGMGEEEADVVELARRVGQLKAEAVPINFFLPIPGTPLTELLQEGKAAQPGANGARPFFPGAGLNPRYCLKVLALFRLANPACELRIAAGREVHLGPLQPLGLYAASSIFVGDYLTTRGQPPEDDYRMIEAMGFEVVLDGTGGS